MDPNPRGKDELIFGNAMTRSMFVPGSLVLVSLLGCDSEPSAPTVRALSSEVMDAVEIAIQDEYRAENTYLRVLADFGNQLPFQNIVYAEERHSLSLAWIFTRRDLPVPLSESDLNNVPRFGTLSEACGAAAEAEVENVAMYDDFLDLSLPNDVRTVFENNREASLLRHLPAFAACS